MTDEPQKNRPEKSTIGKRLFPNLDENSSAMPSDKWITETVFDVVKSNDDLKKNLEETAGYAALSVTSIAAGITGILAFCTVAAPAALVAGGLAAVFGAAAFANMTQENIKKMQAQNLPKVQKEMLLRYIKMTGEKSQKKRDEQMTKDKTDKGAPPPKP
jgi:hypothetical protein